MRLGHEKARRRDLERKPARRYHNPSFIAIAGQASKPFRPGMFEGKSVQEVRATVGTDTNPVFVSVRPEAPDGVL